MASGSQNMTTYNARTVTGSDSAASPAGALLLSGAGRADDAAGDTWIFLDSSGGTSTPWGIKHDQANNKIHIYGNDTDSVWTRMNTGDTYILGKVGIGYDPETSGNSYKLYVNGNTYFNGNTTHNGIDYFANGTTYYINNSGDSRLRYEYADTYTGYDSAGFISSIAGSPWPYIRFDTRAGGSTYVTIDQTNWCQLYAQVPAKRDSTYYKTRFFFRQYSKTANTTTRLGYYEDYYLPETNDGRTDNAGYNILTTKDMSFSITGNAATATKLSNTPNNTTSFLRGDNTWSNTLNATLTVDGIQVPEATTSNWVYGVKWYNANHTKTYFPHIAHHSTGGNGNGSITIIPFATNTSPWGGTEGVYISQTNFKYNNVEVVRNSGTWGISISGNSATTSRLYDSAHSWGATEVYNYMTARVLKAGDTMSGTLAIVNNTQNNTTYNALLYIGHASDNDWGAIISKGSSHDWGLQVICKSDGAYGISVTGRITGTKVYSAVWNDYAECRSVEFNIEAGRVVYETNNKVMQLAYSRLQPGCKVISDTYGMCIGETEEAKTPIAVTGRVLAYPYRARTEYELGAAVCSAPDGTVDIMTRDEIIMYPERIIGTVSEIPDYSVWHAGERDGNHEIEVNGRIWIYVR